MQHEVVALDAEESLGLADDVMRLGRIRHMPVTARGRLVGILSQRDLFRAAISSVLQFRTGVERQWLAKIPVREIMTAHVCSIGPDAPIREAAELMLDKRIGCLPVVEGEKLVGLLSETDCMQHLVRLLTIAETKQQLPELPLLD